MKGLYQFITLDFLEAQLPEVLQLAHVSAAFEAGIKGLHVDGELKYFQPLPRGYADEAEARRLAPATWLGVFIFPDGQITMRTLPAGQRVFIEAVLPLDLNPSEMVRCFKAQLGQCREEVLRIRGARTHREAADALVQVVSGSLVRDEAAVRSAMLAPDDFRRSASSLLRSANWAEESMRRGSQIAEMIAGLIPAGADRATILHALEVAFDSGQAHEQAQSEASTA